MELVDTFTKTASQGWVENTPVLKTMLKLTSFPALDQGAHEGHLLQVASMIAALLPNFFCGVR